MKKYMVWLTIAMIGAVICSYPIMLGGLALVGVSAAADMVRAMKQANRHYYWDKRRFFDEHTL